MNASDLPDVPSVAQGIDAAFRAILAGRFDAPEVLDVLWGCVPVEHDLYWQLRLERAIEMDAAAAHAKSRERFERVRRSIDRKLDDLAAAVRAARSVA